MPHTLPETAPHRARLTFVLLHGAWHGGWCWRRVAEALQGAGHRVSTPTLTGLGERRHLLSSSIDFGTFVDDVVNHLLFEDLDAVVLVGHSFGASVALAVADRDRARLARLVFLDGFLPESGRSLMELRGPEVARARIRDAERSSGGLSMPAPGVAAFGIANPKSRRWVAAKLAPHPLRSYLSPIHLAHPLGNGLPCDYIACTRPRYPGTEWSVDTARGHRWPIHELAAGHDAMVDAPAETAGLLAAIAGSGTTGPVCN